MELLRQSGESLARRIAYLELGPLDVTEVESSGLSPLWVRGGFPDSFLSADDRRSFVWRQNFIRTYLERDTPQFGRRIPAETLRRFWVMLAHAQGGLLNEAALSRGLGVDGKTVSRYMDLMVDLLLVRCLPPWRGVTAKRLVKSPRVYVRDSGIVHALLGLTSKEDLLGHPVVGASWEGFVIETIVSRLPEGSEASFSRSSGGAEIDLVVTLPGRRPWAIEVKRSLHPRPRKGFQSGCNDVQPESKFVVYSGADRYRITPDTEAVPLLDLARKVSRAT